MRLQRAVALLLVALVVPSAAHPSPFDDFRIPSHSSRAWTLGLGTDFRGSTRSTFDSERSTFLRGNTSVGGYWLHDSDDRSVAASASIFGVAEAQTSRGEDFSQFPETGPPDFTALSSRRERNTVGREGWNFFGRARIYPGSGPWGLQANTLASGLYDQTWRTRTLIQETSNLGATSRSENQIHTTAWVYLEAVEASVTAGRGRVRDASGLFRAILLAERLERDRAIARRPTDAGLQKLAQVFYVRPNFSAAHTLADKFFWSEIERVLREDGALSGDGLGAWAVLHAGEPLVVANDYFPRQVGWFAGPVVAARHEHQLTRLDQRNGTRSYVDGAPVLDILTSTRERRTASSDAIWFGAQGEWHRALGTRTQIDFYERALVDFEDDPDGLQLSGLASLSHLAGERWFFELRGQHSRALLADDAVNIWQVATSGRIGYFLEDFCRIDLVAHRAETRFGSPGSAYYRDDSIRLELSVGRGRLDAPGLIAPQRPLN